MYAFPDIARDEARRVGQCSRVCRDIYLEVRGDNGISREVVLGRPKSRHPN